jgi:hypothetical protein
VESGHSHQISARANRLFLIADTRSLKNALRNVRDPTLERRYGESEVMAVAAQVSLCLCI